MHKRNHHIAETLRDLATVLAQQGASPFRINAYRKAAQTLDELPLDLADILAREGVDGLKALPHIGQGIASVIEELLRRGRSSQLERLRGALDPVRLFSTIPGIGPNLATRIHDRLGIDTLEELELAAHDGCLETVPGIG